MHKTINICKDLVKFNTITPKDNGILDYVSNFLNQLGFEVEIREFISPDGKNIVKNLYASYGKIGRILGFLGHLDVVPPGDDWDTNPFGGIEKDGYLYGRGVADMKGGVASFLSAVDDLVSHESNCLGKISIYLTCDEEIGTYEGAQALLEWADKNNKIPDACLIGEPSSNKKICDRVYIGHRGSLNITAKAIGTQRHSAYITYSSKDNALEKICKYVDRITSYKFRYENNKFPETIASPTMINAANLAVNVIPSYAEVNFNIRYSPDYTHEEIFGIFNSIAQEMGLSATSCPSGSAYICDNKELLEIAENSIKNELGYSPEFSAAGGTSDGRYMIKYCPIIEIGMIDETIHKINEKIPITDLDKLKNVYKRFMRYYFKK